MQEFLKTKLVVELNCISPHSTCTLMALTMDYPSWRNKLMLVTRKNEKKPFGTKAVLMSAQMDIPKELRDSGLKATLPRLRILQLFHERQIKHLSAEEIYRFLLDEKIDVGLATIYRVLMQFAEAGILSRRHFESGAAVFELNEGHHHDHLICTSCGKVEEFVDNEIERRQEEIAKDLGFVLQEHSLSLYGICSTCTK